MFEPLKRTLVESYVGAIALGYMLAQGILHFVNIFVSPVALWILRKDFLAFMPGGTISVTTSLRAAIPELVTILVLLPIWYVLLRWLYFQPLKKVMPEQAPASGSGNP